MTTVTHRTLQKTCWLAAAATLLAACGVGGGDGTPAPNAPPATLVSGASTGAMTKSSAGAISVNGVTFALNSATAVRIDDSPKGADDLQSGMIVKVRGRDDGSNGEANEIEVENEVRGPVSARDAAANPQTFTVGGVKVLVDAQTIYANLTPASFDGVQLSTFVEVHGIRNAAGNLRATRVEGKGPRNPAAAEVDELRGTIRNPIANTSFNLGPVLVSYGTGTTFTPAARCSAAMMSAGRVVEVHGAFTSATAFAATRIDCEDEEDERMRPGNGNKNEVEGFVVGLNTTTRTFSVNGQAVSYSTGTQFRNGTIDDLVDNAKVEVEGTMNGTTLVAREINFKRVRVILTMRAEAVNVAAKSLTLFGKTVQVNDLTELRTQNTGGQNSATLADIVAGADRVEVRAFTDGTAIVAERVTEIGNSGGGRDIVQARVTAENETTFTLGLLDTINAALGGAGVQFQNLNDQPITRAQFFAAVTAGANGTLVKVKGTYAGGVLSAEEAELED
jgi:hypothetical protein